MFLTRRDLNLCPRVVGVLTLTRIIKSVVTGQAPVTPELRNTLGESTNNPRWYTYIIKIKIHSSCEIEDFVETHLVQSVCDTPNARITSCVSSLRI